MSNTIGTPVSGRGRRQDRDGEPLENPIETLTAATRHDFTLGFIPVVFAVAAVVASATGLSVVQALAPAAFVSLFVVVDAIYLNPPIDSGVDTDRGRGSA
ncbi:hypothetical protein [Natronoglomus mannanivorans]|uniref:Uncharacterized protein n=1 Tax=Natronoglomus mannanivorans TaxID=2979990 RepID=A0AAP3E257_9EURY|nr:hypothetical protein [Halobacteria archaeon AArc-xg1-1]